MTEWRGSGNRRIEQLKSFGVQHHSLNANRSLPIKALERVLKMSPRSVSLLKSRIRGVKPDLIVFNSGTLTDGVELLETVHEMCVPCVAVTHLVSSDNWPDDILAGRIHRAFSSSIEVGFVSKHNHNLYVRQTGRSLSKAKIVRNPFLVSVGGIQQPPHSPDLPMRLALPARLHPRTKGQDMLFDVLSRPRWNDRKIIVSLFGSGGCENTLKNLSLELGIADKVIFAGHANDMNAVWRDHHALVLPSRHEGLPIAMIEAMWAGRTVIATPAGGIPEMMKHGLTGFLASACNSDALDAAMEEAWENRERWPAMGEEGRRFVQDNIPADPVRVWAHHLQDLIASSPDGRSGKP
jgi:glycosyltransferase involved in cell wall biosynthesis